MSPIIAVIGASRGIGLELVNQLSKSPTTTVISATRTAPSSPLPPNVQAITLDLTNSSSITAAAKPVPELDTLIINAAMGYGDHLASTDSTTLLSYLDTNVVGPNRIIQAFLPALLARKTRRIILMSSSAGSLKLQLGSKFGLHGPYAVSKAALNMLAVQWHNELDGEEFTVVPLHPGWVATDMGNIAGSGAMSVEKSVSGILKVVEGLRKEDSGKFFDFDGEIMPW